MSLSLHPAISIETVRQAFHEHEIHCDRHETLEGLEEEEIKFVLCALYLQNTQTQQGIDVITVQGDFTKEKLFILRNQTGMLEMSNYFWKYVLLTSVACFRDYRTKMYLFWAI